MKLKVRFLLFFGMILILSGCCTPINSGVLPMGPDTFSVSADSFNASNAKKSALGQAEKHCSRLGKEILVIKTAVAKADGNFIYDVTFRCLSKDDPELKRPTYKQSPDVLIEDNRK
jgi:hypothetical protein